MNPNFPIIPKIDTEHLYDDNEEDFMLEEGEFLADEIQVLEEEFDPNYSPTQEGFGSLILFNLNRDPGICGVPGNGSSQRPKVFLSSQRRPTCPSTRAVETLSKQE